MKDHATGKTAPSASEYGRGLKGLGFNLLVTDVPGSVDFATRVLGATCLFNDTDFAALRWNGADFMFHADRAYRGHPLSGVVDGLAARGAGVELRLYDCDPDAAEARARELGFTVLAGSIDKEHGLRECVILDEDGYAWVPTAKRA